MCVEPRRLCVCVAWNRFRLELDALRLRRSRTGNLEMELTRDQPKQTGMGKTTKQVHTLPFFAPIYAVEKIWNFSLTCKNKIIFHWGKNLTIAVACCSFSTSLVVFIYICTTRKSLPTSVSKLVCVFLNRGNAHRIIFVISSSLMKAIAKWHDRSFVEILHQSWRRTKSTSHLEPFQNV